MSPPRRTVVTGALAAPPRVVFASTITVFGPPLPPLVDDGSLRLPVMTCGAQKRMIEVVAARALL